MESDDLRHLNPKNQTSAAVWPEQRLYRHHEHVKGRIDTCLHRWLLGGRPEQPVLLERLQEAAPESHCSAAVCRACMVMYSADALSHSHLFGWL